MPKISIITTTYKHQDFIAETIESVLAQSYTDWELLIGDDSPDNKTWKIIEKYVKKYPDKIKTWHHSPNKGIVENMNFLIDKSDKNSKYIAFLEGDDLFTSDNLEERINIFNKNKTIEAVINNYLEINSFGNKIGFSNFKFLFNYFGFSQSLNKSINNLTEKDFIVRISNPIKSFGTVILKKSLLLKHFPLINLDKGNKMFGPLDYFLWIKLFSNKDIYYTDKKLFKYRVHENNFSGDGNIELMGYQTDLIFDDLNKKNKKLDKIILFRKELKKGIINAVKGKKIEGFKNLIMTFKYFKFRYLGYRMKLFIRLLMPNFIINFILNRGK